MATAGEIVTLGPRPLPRVWATAASTYPLLEGPEWEPDELGVKRWLNGATFSPFGCEKSIGATFDPCVERETDYIESGECVDFYPFLIETAVQAPTRTASPEFMQEYVLAHTELSRSKIMAEQVERSEYNPLSPSLASEAQIVANTDQSLMGALMGVEEALADVLDGGAGMIHIPAHLLVALQSGGGLRYDADGRAYTATGHVIVADAGTLGVSPSTMDVVEGELWIYGSAPVFAKWDDVVTFAPARAYENADIRRNKFLVDAEQHALALFEPCSVVAAVVDVSDSDIVLQGSNEGSGGDASATITRTTPAVGAIASAETLHGWSLYNSHASDAVLLYLRYGDGASDTPFRAVAIAAGQSVNVWNGHRNADGEPVGADGMYVTDESGGTADITDLVGFIATGAA